MSPTSGGVERISCVLGNWFSERGCKVYYLSDCFLDGESIFVNNGTGLKDPFNIDSLIRFIKDESIDFIINQAGILPASEPLLSIGKSRSKLISVFHNSLRGMYTHPNFYFNNFILKKIFDSRIMQNLFLFYFYLKYHAFFKNVVSKSDAIVLLSEAYINEVKYFAGCDAKVLECIGNPLTLPLDTNSYSKQKEILFIGRLNFQKRPDVLLDIWNCVSVNHPDWVLRILGDGPMRDYLKKRISSNMLRNVFLEGNQQPEIYLKSASILCMTSCYEGFPLVLFEAMNYEVVPVAFDSFESINEIIDDGENGFIVPANDKRAYCDQLQRLMVDEKLLKDMSGKCRKKVVSNTVEIIGEKWLNLFRKM